MPGEKVLGKENKTHLKMLHKKEGKGVGRDGQSSQWSTGSWGGWGEEVLNLSSEDLFTC